MTHGDMVGRRVTAPYGETGEVIRWEPLGAGMCDTLVRQDDGHDVWHGSGSLRPSDGLGPLPRRGEAQERNRLVSLAQLREIRAKHVRDFRAPWPGIEHGKAILGMSIDAAIRDLENQ